MEIALGKTRLRKAKTLVLIFWDSRSNEGKTGRFRPNPFPQNVTIRLRRFRLGEEEVDFFLCFPLFFHLLRVMIEVYHHYFGPSRNRGLEFSPKEGQACRNSDIQGLHFPFHRNPYSGFTTLSKILRQSHSLRSHPKNRGF